MSEVRLGQLVEGDGRRDAVHVPVVAAVATRVLQPGERLTNGIVDPFLTEPVQKGQRYWLCLLPGSTTAVRHCWSHSAFPDEPQLPMKRRTEADVWPQVEEVA